MEHILGLEETQLVEEFALQKGTLAMTAIGQLRQWLLLVKREMEHHSTCMNCHPPHSVHWYIVLNRVDEVWHGITCSL